MELSVTFIFDDYESRARGLQGRVLAESACALFVYDFPTRPRFHMSNVPTDLYLSSIVGGECVQSELMEKGSGEIYAITGETQVVVESRVPIEVGSEVDLVGGRLVVT